MNGDRQPKDQQPSSTTKQASPSSLRELLDHFVEATDGQSQVTISDLLDSLSSRSHGPMLLFPALIAISPLGMIPGMSIVTGTLIILVAVQMLFFSGRPYVPKRIARFEFSRERLKKNVEKWQRWVRGVEKVIRPRFEFLTSGVMVYPIAVVAIGLAVLFYPLAFVPFGVLVPGSAIALFALALTSHDGILAALGFLLTAAAGYLAWAVWPF